MSGEDERLREVADAAGWVGHDRNGDGFQEYVYDKRDGSDGSYPEPGSWRSRAPHAPAPPAAMKAPSSSPSVWSAVLQQRQHGGRIGGGCDTGTVGVQRDGRSPWRAASAAARRSRGARHVAVRVRAALEVPRG